MIPLSCVNCCHNPLQSDAIGTPTGYCTEHKKVLLAPSQLTCGRHFRKDLPAATAAREREVHERRFTPAAIVKLTAGARPVNGGYVSAGVADIDQVKSDPVGIAAVEYGTVDSKISSLAQLRFLKGARPELAMTSLGRAYVNRCVANNGRWTSGVHLVWWTRSRLLDEPEIHMKDLRTESPAGLARQVELAKWSVVMMRLILISDVASYARKAEPISRLASFAEEAAEQSGDLSDKRLLGWLGKEGTRLFDDVLPEARYRQIARKLHRDDPA